MAENANDNRIPGASGTNFEADPHGEAAMLLVESLIHGLIARSVISVEEAIEIVETAAEVKAAISDELGSSADARQTSLSLLTAISNSLALDVRGGHGQ